MRFFLIARRVIPRRRLNGSANDRQRETVEGRVREQPSNPVKFREALELLRSRIESWRSAPKETRAKQAAAEVSLSNIGLLVEAIASRFPDRREALAAEVRRLKIVGGRWYIRRAIAHSRR